MSNITSAIGKEELTKLRETTTCDILSPNKFGNLPSFVIKTNQCGDNYSTKSFLYNFPGSDDIGLITKIQYYDTSDHFMEVIRIAEEILLISGMSAITFTCNSGFKYEKTALKLGFKKVLEETNPHSGRLIRFFLKEI